MSTGPEGGCACGAVRYRLTSQPLFVLRCARCQIAVFSEYGRPGLWFVRGGTLDDPLSIKPDVHIYTRSKVEWLELPEGVPAFAAYYETNKLWPADSLRRLQLASSA
jgi:hypothetical protein